VSEAGRLLHHRASRLPRFKAASDLRSLPASGVYVMFERGERAHGGDRIVRIGSHSGHSSTLAQRLQEHLVKANKDRSIFRKHVGRCILAARNDPFLAQWNLDLIGRANRQRSGATVDPDRLAAVEREITDYLTRSISFVVWPVAGKPERLETERALLSTVATCSECHASPAWLGRSHPDHRIRRLGLWNVQGVSGPPLAVGAMRKLVLAAGDDVAELDSARRASG
jgi:hypothetical protein